MKRSERTAIVLALMALGALGALVCRSAFVKLADFREKLGSVTSVCWSDRLHPLAGKLSAHAHENEGRLPEATLVPSLVGNSAPIPTCAGSNAPFRWNQNMGQFRLEGETDHILAWCPIGSHKNYAGVIVLRQGNIESEVMSTQEFMRWLADEISAAAIPEGQPTAAPDGEDTGGDPRR